MWMKKGGCFEVWDVDGKFKLKGKRIFQTRAGKLIFKALIKWIMKFRKLYKCSVNWKIFHFTMGFSVNQLKFLFHSRVPHFTSIYSLMLVIYPKIHCTTSCVYEYILGYFWMKWGCSCMEVLQFFCRRDSFSYDDYARRRIGSKKSWTTSLTNIPTTKILIEFKFRDT